ncbi:MAG: UvrD-helicase domain-containing protein, partial [Christensenellales bacterium]
MKKDLLQVNLNTRKTVLSSRSLFYKTENFIKSTKYVTNIDFLLSKLSETILLNLNDILTNEKQQKDDIDCFLITMQDNLFSFYFKFGFQIGLDLNNYDLVFFNFTSKSNNQVQTIDEYVKSNNINILIKKDKRLVKTQDFNKLYLISNVSNVNLPRLNTEQRNIVETIDKNILVQGVAGSGKTNICIDKIIFTACKNYSGKILYTTFSRGLLSETKLKIELYKKDLQEILNNYKSN